MDVRQIITSNLSDRGLSGYQHHAEPIITEIETRLSDALDNLTAFAVDKGLSAEEAHRAFVEAGLVTVYEAPTPETPDISRLETRIERLTAFARRHGFRD